jgi:chromosomal replication initiation ATPase DnaA
MTNRKNLGPQHALALQILFLYHGEVLKAALREWFKRYDAEQNRLMLEVRDYFQNNHVKEVSKAISDAWWDLQGEELNRSRTP